MKTATWNEVRKITEGPAFNRVGAWVIINEKGDICGTVKILYPRDGAGKLTAIFHEHGFEPQKGTASGYGYDKASAALSGASINGHYLVDSGRDWTDQLRDFGYKVYQAC